MRAQGKFNFSLRKFCGIDWGLVPSSQIFKGQLSTVEWVGNVKRLWEIQRQNKLSLSLGQFIEILIAVGGPNDDIRSVKLFSNAVRTQCIGVVSSLKKGWFIHVFNQGRQGLIRLFAIFLIPVRIVVHLTQ